MPLPHIGNENHGRSGRIRGAFPVEFKGGKVDSVGVLSFIPEKGDSPWSIFLACRCLWK